MSSQGVEVSSNDEYSDNAGRTDGFKNDSLLHPNWSGLSREVKNKAKSTCGVGSKKGSEVDQIQYYKEKAHQSFMQVIQVQQLHDEQIEQLKEQYQSRIDQLEKQLQHKNETIEVYAKNSQHHILDLEKTLEIEGLDLIECQENNLTRFDESTILSFKEFLSEKEGDAKIESMRDKIFKFITAELTKIIPNSDNLIKNIKDEINSIFSYVKEVRHELLSKVQSHQALLKRYEQIDLNHKKLKTRFQTIQKDAALMAENLQRLKEEKITFLQKTNQLQNRIIELEKQLRVQQNSKEALLKISLQDNKSGLTSSKNILATSKCIPSTYNSNRFKICASQKHLEQKSHKNIQEDHVDVLCDKNKETDLMKSGEQSFDIQDLIAEIGDDRKLLGGTQYGKVEKRTQHFVPLPLTTRNRKKSSEN